VKKGHWPETVQQRYDFFIFDSGPTNATTDLAKSDPLSGQ